MSKKNKFVSQFGTLSRYGELRKISLLYGSEKSLIWQICAEGKDSDFIRSSCDPFGNIESIDLPGGPMISVGDDFFGFGKIEKIAFLSMTHKNGLPSYGMSIILSCATSKIVKGKSPIGGKRKSAKRARKVSTGE